MTDEKRTMTRIASEVFAKLEVVIVRMIGSHKKGDVFLIENCTIKMYSDMSYTFDEIMEAGMITPRQVDFV